MICVTADQSGCDCRLDEFLGRFFLVPGVPAVQSKICFFKEIIKNELWVGLIKRQRLVEHTCHRAQNITGKRNLWLAVWNAAKSPSSKRVLELFTRPNEKVNNAPDHRVKALWAVGIAPI